MKNKKLLTIILLGVVLCFMVSGMGHGEIIQLTQEANISNLDYSLLEARLNYMMRYPHSFLDVTLDYGSGQTLVESLGGFGEQGKERILVWLIDTRGRFYAKSGVVLLDEFKEALEFKNKGV